MLTNAEQPAEVVAPLQQPATMRRYRAAELDRPRDVAPPRKYSPAPGTQR